MHFVEAVLSGAEFLTLLTVDVEFVCTSKSWGAEECDQALVRDVSAHVSDVLIDKRLEQVESFNLCQSELESLLGVRKAILLQKIDAFCLSWLEAQRLEVEISVEGSEISADCLLHRVLVLRFAVQDRLLQRTSELNSLSINNRFLLRRFLNLLESSIIRQDLSLQKSDQHFSHLTYRRHRVICIKEVVIVLDFHWIRKGWMQVTQN